MLSAVQVFIFLCGRGVSAQKDASAIREGRELYQQHCISCHGLEGTGDGPAASALKVPPADLTRISHRSRGFPSEKVLDWIEGEKYAVGHGSREMPVWGKRFRRAGQTGRPGEIQALASYLESIQKK
jgi:mono/diheme cytochrome c family protein